MDKVLCTMIFVYLLLKKKKQKRGAALNIASYTKNDKQEQVCKAQQELLAVF